MDAEEFAKLAYAGIKRKNGEDFINHPIRVKKLLEDIGIKDKTILDTALLHAVIKEGNVTEQELLNNFGEEITGIVKNLNIISKIAIPITDSPKMIKNLHKVLLHLAKDIRVLLIRLADRVDNIQTADKLDAESQKWIAQKAFSMYAPMAKAAGIYSFTRILEDHALKITDAKNYTETKKIITNKFSNAEKDISEIKSKLSNFLQKNSCEYKITRRKKGIYSTFKKAKRKGCPASNLNDLWGIRVIVKDINTCYKVLAFIQVKWSTDSSKFDDYIANPKPNGYKSLQIPIKLSSGYGEVQIRTFEMDEFNEYGAASHFSYKYKSDAAWMKHLINMKEEIQNGITGNHEIKLFEDEIFVFTPANEVIALPKGSTSIDFAYHVHTDIGNHICQAKVNGKVVSLDTQLQSGHTVEIITRKNQRPSLDWLRMTQTTEAKRRIKKAIEL